MTVSGVWHTDETWPLIGLRHPFSIFSSNVMVGLPQSKWILDSLEQWEFPPFLKNYWQSPCTALTAGIVRAVQADRERVYAGLDYVQYVSRWGGVNHINTLSPPQPCCKILGVIMIKHPTKAARTAISSVHDTPYNRWIILKFCSVLDSGIVVLSANFRSDLSIGKIAVDYLLGLSYTDCWWI